MAGFEYDDKATQAIINDTLASGVVGLRGPSMPLPNTSGGSISRQVADRLNETNQMMAQLQAPSPQQQGPSGQVGYNPATNQIFSNGRLYKADDLYELSQAQKRGDLDGSQAPIPQEFNIADVGQFHARISKMQNSGPLGDTMTSLKRGVLGIPGAITGVSDAITSLTPTGLLFNRPADKITDAIGEFTGFRPSVWKERAAAEYSPGFQQSQQEIDTAWDAVQNDFNPETTKGMLSALATNPMYTLTGPVAESVPSMVAGGIAGRGAMMVGSRAVAARAGGMGPTLPGTLSRTFGDKAGAVAAGIGEGSVSAGAMMDSIPDTVDPQRAALASLGAGVGVGLVGYGGGRLASHTHIGDIEAGLAGGAPVDLTKRTLPARVAGGIFTEGVLEELPQSMWEQGMSNFAQDKPFTEGMARAGVEGMLAGGVMGGAFNMRRSRTPSEPQLTTEQHIQNQLGANARYNFTRGIDNLGEPVELVGPNEATPIDSLYQRLTAERNGQPWQHLGEGNYGGLMPTGPKAKKYGPQIPLTGAEGVVHMPAMEGLPPGVAPDGYGSLVPSKTPSKAEQRANENASSEGNIPVPTAEERLAAAVVPKANYTPGQQGVVEYISQALAEGRDADVIDAQGVLQFEKIGQALGIKRGSAKSFVNGAMKKIAAAQGVTVAQMKTALAARSVGQIEDATEAKLGLPPAQQDSAVNEADLFGSEEGGAQQTMGVINSIGGSQSDVGTGDADLPSIAWAESDNALENKVRERGAKQESARRFSAEQEERKLQRRADARAAFESMRDAEETAAPVAEVVRQIDIDAALREWEQLDGTELPEQYHIQWTKLFVANDMGLLADRHFQEAYLEISNAVESGKVQPVAGETPESTGPRASIGRTVEETGGQDNGAAAAEEVVQPASSASEEVTAQGVIDHWNQGAKALGVVGYDGLSSDQQNYLQGSGTWAEFDEAAAEVLDEINGSPAFSELEAIQDELYNDDVRLSDGRQWGTVGDTTLMQYVIRDGETAIGRVSIGLRNGKPNALYHIELNKDAQGKGWGRKVVQALLDSAEADLYIQNIVPKAVGFYEALGVTWLTETKNHGDAILEKASEGTARATDENAQRQELSAKRSETEAPTHHGSTAQEVSSRLKKAFFSPEKFNALVTVVQTADQLPATAKRDMSTAKGKVQGFIGTDGKVYLIAENIQPGKELAVFLHEVGVHLGMEKLIGKASMDRLVSQIEQWAADTNNKSLEAQLARAAIARAEKSSSENKREEILAYFVEKAVDSGINPMAVKKQSAALTQWFRTLWAAAKLALRKIGLQRFDQMTAQNFVDLAYGAAKLELTGAWHGTAADFRNFDHTYMGSGEGAQAFGWGTYLAQRVGIAKEYWKADVERKKGPTAPARRPIPPIKKQFASLKDYFAAVRHYKQRLRDFAPVRFTTANGSKYYVISNNEIIRDKANGTSFTANNIAYISPEAVTAVNDLRSKAEDAEIGVTTDYEVTGWNTVDVHLHAGEDTVVVEAYSLPMEGTHPLETADFGGSHPAIHVGSRIVEVATRGDRPEGALMRVDTAVHDDEFLDWDKPLSEQSEVVKKALENEPFWRKTVDWYGSGDGWTGAEYYKKLTHEKGSDKAASEYLDSIGIKGIKFLDQPSRGAAQVKEMIVKPVTAKGGKQAWVVFEKESVGAVGMPMSGTFHYTEAAAEAEVAEIKAAASNQTRNLVIFNDKNIQRVSSQMGASRESDKIKFSESSIESVTEKLPESLRKSSFVLATNMADLAKRGLYSTAFGHDLAKLVKKHLPQAKRFFDIKGQQSATLTDLESKVDEILEAASAAEDKDKLNAFLNESTRTGKWGFKPAWNKDAVVDPAMKAKFDALSATSKKAAQDIFQYGHDNVKQLNALVKSELTDGYDTEGMTAEQIKEVEKKKLRALALFDKTFKAMQGPYAPLVRVGAYVTSAKSQAYLDAVANDDTDLVEKLQADPEHYYVEFHESLGEAQWEAKELAKTGKYATGDNAPAGFAKEEYYNRHSETPWAALKRVRGMIEAEGDSATSKAERKAARDMRNMLNDLYFQTLAEGSARQFQNKRRKIAGEMKDMLRAFAIKGRADANFIAHLTHSTDLGDAITEMRAAPSKASSEKRADVVRALNAVLGHQAASMEYRQQPWLSKVQGFTSFQMLVTNPAYYLTNATQPFMMTLPWLAGRFGYARSWGAFFKAYTDLTKGGLSVDELKDSKRISEAEYKMLKGLKAAGILDIGINRELGYWENSDNAGLNLLAKTQHFFSRKVQQLEMVNRISSALAAYRLSGGKADVAADAIRATHGDYSQFNEPLFFSKVPGARVLLQFRKFQIIQLSLMARLIHQSFKGNAEEKLVAQKSLAFLLGHVGVMAGGLGLPFMNLIGPLVASALGGAGDPDDEEYLLRKALGDKKLADLLLRGVPAWAGVNMSSRVGMQNMTSLAPFANKDVASREGFQERVTALLGPWAGLGTKMADGVGLTLKGDVYKGVEQMLPNGVSNMMRAYRQATEGVTQRNNDLVMSPEEVQLLTTTMQALGLPTTQLTDRQRIQGNLIEFEKNFNAKASEIKKDYAEAARKGGDVGKYRQEWQELQDAKTRNGFKASPLSELLKAPNDQMKRERNVVGGVEYKKSNADAARNLVNM